MPEKITSHEIRHRLRRRYSDDGWRYALFEEIQDGTGEKGKRRIDALVMELWPSDGLNLTAFEVKVDRQDWLRELDNVPKAAPFLKLCNYFYVVAPKGVVELEELPEKWGLMIPTKTGLRISKRAWELCAPMTELPITFVASILREATRNRASVHDIRIAQDKARLKERTRVEKIHSDREKSYRKLAEALDTFEKHSGIRISTWNDNVQLGMAVSLIQKLGKGAWGVRRLRELADKLTRAAVELESLPEDLGVIK